MRSLLLVFALAACTEHGRGGGGDPVDDPAQPPESCSCISDGPPPISGACCGSNVCFLDEGEWQIAICDELPGGGS